jgi:hypothetical protein
LNLYTHFFSLTADFSINPLATVIWVASWAWETLVWGKRQPCVPLRATVTRHPANRRQVATAPTSDNYSLQNACVHGALWKSSTLKLMPLFAVVVTGRNSPVSTVTGQRAARPRNKGSIPGRHKTWRPNNGSAAPTASYPVSIAGAISREMKRPRSGTGHSPLPSVEVNNGSS